MAPRPPVGFVGVVEANERRDQQPYDVIGLCTDYLPPAQSRGSDLAMKLNLWDGSCLDSLDLGQDGMLVRMFYGKKRRFPAVQEIGDVVILRRLRTLNQHGTWLGLSNKITTWTVISYTSLLDSKDPTFADVELRSPYETGSVTETGQNSRPSINEFRYAKALLEARDPTTFRAPPKSTALDVATIQTASGARPRRGTSAKYRMLKDLLDPTTISGAQYVDLLGMICRVYTSGNPVEMKITDFTEHALLYDYGGENDTGFNHDYVRSRENTEFPKGRMTIRLQFWDENAQYLQDLSRKDQIKLHMYIRIKNVSIKMDRNGVQLEGHVRGNNNSKFGPSIILLQASEAKNDEALKSLLQRKHVYENARKAEVLGIKQYDVVPAKRPADNIAVQPSKPSKAQRKKQKQREKEKEKERKAAEDTGSTASRSLTNQHVRCEAVDITLTTVSAILDEVQLKRTTRASNEYKLPFQNCKYKSKVKVIDFFPDNLEDFATPYRSVDYNALSNYESEDDEPVSQEYVKKYSGDVRWQWHFFLVVEDPTSPKTPNGNTATMLLQAAGQDGDYLLNMEASDLRNQTQQFASMKEKLFVLWGDLEEKKAENKKSGLDLKEAGVAVSSTPFECLIREYGVQARTEDGRIIDDQYERMFALFKTNIG